MRIVNKSDVKEHLQELLAVQITEDMPIYEVYDDSIKMFQVLSKINNGFHINLGMIDLVMCDTVDKLIEKITLESKNIVNIVGEEQLSLIQQSYWIGREQEFYGASNSTHLYLEVHHNLDLMKLEKVIRTLIKRHGALRSIIKEEKQFIFEEKIADTFCLETINIGREEKEKYFKKLRYNNQTRLRDLENWPLFDVKNICIDTCENFLLVDIEMIIVDGMSLQLILKDFWDIYSNSKFDVQEIDYLKCAKSVRETRDKRKYEIDKEYWMQRLPLIPNAPKLPECKIWDESNICSRLQRKIEKEEWAALEKMAKDSGVNSTNDFVTKVWGNILTKEIITKSVVPDLLKSIDLKQIKILDYAQELCPPDVKGQVYVSESEIMNDRNKTYYKILEHPLYGRMADTGIIGVLTHDGYMEFVVPNCETSVETPDKKEDTHEEEIEKPIVKEIMKIWKEVFEIEDISIQDDFYTLGGDSIILMRLVDEMCKTLGCDVTVDDILQSENISDLANRV